MQGGGHFDKKKIVCLASAEFHCFGPLLTFKLIEIGKKKNSPTTILQRCISFYAKLRCDNASEKETGRVLPSQASECIRSTNLTTWGPRCQRCESSTICKKILRHKTLQLIITFSTRGNISYMTSSGAHKENNSSLQQYR